MKKNAFIYQLLLIIIFFVCIGLPLFQDNTHVFTLQKLKTENRAIAKFPVFDLKKLDPFPSQFSAYYNDNFPFRTIFFQYDYRILIKESPVKEVIIGRNKWLFLSKNSKLYQGLTPFSEKDLQKTVRSLEERMKVYKEMGIKFYFIIAPSSYEIYSEYLPHYILRAKTTKTDKFCELLQNTDIPFIYLKEELLKNKTAGQLYRKNDHHWNSLGCYFAYKATVDLIKKDFPQIPVYSLDDFEMTPHQTSSGNIVNMLNDNFKAIFGEDIYYKVQLKDSCKRYYNVPKVGYPCIEGFPYPWVYEVTGETSNKELPNIVIIRDSYFSEVVQFFYNSFSRSVAIFDKWRYGANMDIVSQENPKIVLLFLIETNIPNSF